MHANYELLASTQETKRNGTFSTTNMNLEKISTGKKQQCQFQCHFAIWLMKMNGQDEEREKNGKNNLQKVAQFLNVKAITMANCYRFESKRD